MGRWHYEASFQTECQLHCSLTMFQHRVKCFSGEKMCLTTPSQVVTSSLKSPGSFFTKTQVGWIGQRGGLISDSLLGMWCCAPKVQLHSLQWGRKGIELPSGPGLTPGLVFIQVVRNNVFWRQGSEMAGCCTVCTYTMGTFTNNSISVF